MSRKVISLDAHGPNLLTDDAWESIIPEVPFARDGDTFECPAAPEGVAVIDKPDEKVEAGACQTVVLNQKSPQVIVASVWSKSEEAFRMRHYDYCLMLQLIDYDGNVITSSWTPFKEATHDWTRADVRVIPPAPVKEVSVRLRYLGQGGRAWFKDPEVRQVTAEAPVVSLDALPLDKVDGPEEGFWVRDVAAGSDLVQPADGKALGLELQFETTQVNGATQIAGTVRDTTGEDRAVTLIYTVPVDGKDVRWLVHPRCDKPTAAPGEYSNVSFTEVGSNGMLSRWPMAAVADDDHGWAISLDMGKPAFYRVGYSAGTGELYIAFDIALTPERPHADLAFSTFDFDPAWGFRGVLAKLYEVYPDYFRCRTPDQGLWLPFLSPRGVKGWEDFGFTFQEGAGDSEWSLERGVLSFEYTEPVTWWMAIPPEVPRTMENAMKHAQALADAGDAQAKSFFTSVFHDENGRFLGKALFTPWCDGIVWSMNSSPSVAGENHFQTKWNDTVVDRLYGPNRVEPVSGHYVDSAEGYITEELNYRRDHFGTSETPLAFALQTNQPAVFMGLIVWEYVHGMAMEVRKFDKLMMANTTPGRFCWLSPWLDVLGTETNWHIDEKWGPLNDAAMLFYRGMCATKPYCFLMNTDFTKWRYEHSELYMKRCVAYGMYPGYFSANAAENAYFSDPKLYDRDRDLFKRYVPLCRRVGEAGWRPVTNAYSSDEKVYVERFGDNILTVFNDAGDERTVTVTLLGDWPSECTDLVTGQTLTAGGKIKLTLGNEDVAALAFE